MQQIANAGLGYELGPLKTMRDALKSGSETKIAQAEERLRISQERLALAQEKAVGPSVSQTNALADVLAQVPSYESREQALSDFEKYSSSIRTRVGDQGFQQVQQEIDRLFPAQALPLTSQSSQQNIEQGFLARIFSAFID